MTDQEAREFVEMLAVPETAEPPPCPICGRGHPLETRCPLSTDRRPRSRRAAGAPFPETLQRTLLQMANTWACWFWAVMLSMKIAQPSGAVPRSPSSWG
jgi:hypothetical protein